MHSDLTFVIIAHYALFGSSFKLFKSTVQGTDGADGYRHHSFELSKL